MESEFGHQGNPQRDSAFNGRALAEIESGIAEADRGEFASDDDVARVVGKYVKTPSRL
jgi:predicted transcriptional regulator